MAALGLRGKSLLALLLTCLLALGMAGLIGWQALKGVQNRYGEAYARNVAQLNREKIAAPVSRELALAMRLADSQITRQWLLDEDDPEKRALFFREAAGFQKAFAEGTYFVAGASRLGYYFNDGNKPFSDQPRYLLRRDEPGNDWFFRSLADPAPYKLNVDHNPEARELKVWFNIPVNDGERRIGVLGSGIRLTSFLDDFVTANTAGVLSMVLDAQASILVHPDEDMVAENADGLTGRSLATSLYGQLDNADDSAAVRGALADAKRQPGSVETLWVSIDGRPQLLALAWIAELDWYVASAIDLGVAQVIELDSLVPALVAFAIIMLLLLGGIAWLVERRVLKPLRLLRHSARAMAAGQYDAPLPIGRDDEIGELSAAFGVMAQKVRSHTSELESRVRERTRALEQANREMAAAHKKIDDSIDYASLIQHAILPRRQMISALGERHAVLWRPRDVVGGDFYVYRAGAGGCLFGVVDCAGHGVPGALMTMLGHAAIDQAIADVGLHDPAGVLARTDRIVRSMLREEGEQQALATNMDIGLAYVDFQRRDLTFAGAKVALYYSDGETLEELPPARRAIGDKRVGEYVNARVGLHSGRTFYLTTDGFLDQAGGELGYGFGNSRFAEMIRRHARLPLAEQSDAFIATLAEYQGDYPQRDDITILCFRFD
jgi:sigma-B regulation protein RsbU (phosphoserine phosphatase)